MKTILILKGVHDEHNTLPLIHAIAARWAKAGYRVLTHYGTGSLPDADVVILHVNATVVPESYRECLARYPVVLNRNVLDISKRRISRNLVTRDTEYAGPVIVKTNANFGGVPEAYARDLSRWIPWPRLQLFRRTPGWETLTQIEPDNYPVFEHVADVPPGVWKNPNLVVEKFRPEREGDLFYLRYWMFLGDRERSSRYGAASPIVKFRMMATPEQRVPVPDELRKVRTQLGFDYGRFDYVVDDGETVLLDTNKTVGGGPNTERYTAELDLLANGLGAFDRTWPREE